MGGFGGVRGTLADKAIIAATKMPLKVTEPELKNIGFYFVLRFGSQMIEFAEDTQIKDKRSLLEIRKILELSYTDKITAIRTAYIDVDGDIAGVFEDAVSPNLTKRLRFKISNEDISYALLNPNKVTSFTSIFEFATATKNKNCKKGIPCKGTCIAANRTCRNSTTPTQQSAIASIKQQAATSTNNQGARPISTLNSANKGTSSPPASLGSGNPAIKINDDELDAKRKDLEKRFGKKAVEDAENNVHRILKDPDVGVYVRVGSSTTLEAILGDRFKTSAELGVDTHQIPHLKDGYQKARNRVEAKALGYDEKNTNPQDRPIYGYLGGKDLNGAAHKDVAEAYGSITVRLKPEVKERTTFTGADSFKSGIASNVKNAGNPPPPNAASLVSSTRHGYDKDNLPAGYPSNYKSKSEDKAQLIAAAKAKNIDDLAQNATTGNKYVEAQIHGKVTPKDIAEIHFQPKKATDRPTSAIASFAKDNGVDLYVSGKKLSQKELDDIITPPKPSDKRSQRLKDLDDALKKGDFNKVAEYTEKIYDDAQKQKMASGETDKVLKQLYQDSGYDGKPEIKSKAEMDKLAQGGAVMMVRGVDGKDAKKYADEFKTGDYFVGNGIYGNGTYVGHSGGISSDGSSFIAKSNAAGQRRAWKDVAKHQYIKDEQKTNAATLRMALSDDAVVVTAKVMKKDIEDLLKKVDAWEKSEKQKVSQSSSPPNKKEGDAYKKSLDIANARIESSTSIKYIGLSAELHDYVIPHKNSKYGADIRVSLIDITISGRGYTFTAPDGSEVKVASNNINDAMKSVREAYAQHETTKNTSIGKLKEIEQKSKKMREVLGIMPKKDLENGTSGRYAVVRGIDAVALNNSYEKKSFMNLLNRSKVVVQDENLSYADGKKKGVGV